MCMYIDEPHPNPNPDYVAEFLSTDEPVMSNIVHRKTSYKKLSERSSIKMIKMIFFQYKF